MNIYSEANLGILRDIESFRRTAGLVKQERVSIGDINHLNPDFRNYWARYSKLNDQSVGQRLEQKWYPRDGMARLLKYYFPEYETVFYIKGGAEVKDLSSRLLLLGLENNIKAWFNNNEINMGIPVVDLMLAVNQARKTISGAFEIIPRTSDRMEFHQAEEQTKNSPFWLYIFGNLEN